MKNLNERDMKLLSSIDDMIRLAPEIGVCPMAFKTLKEEVLFIMGERDALKEAIKK